jgi:hypothetical protein
MTRKRIQVGEVNRPIPNAVPARTEGNSRVFND